MLGFRRLTIPAFVPFGRSLEVIVVVGVLEVGVVSAGTTVTAEVEPSVADATVLSGRVSELLIVYEGSCMIVLGGNSVSKISC